MNDVSAWLKRFPSSCTYKVSSADDLSNIGGVEMLPSSAASLPFMHVDERIKAAAELGRPDSTD